MPRPKEKWQTRLTFSPLPSSSPATAGYPEQLQGRAAAIGYDSPGRPIKKRRVDNDLSNSAMLSPISSSPVPGFTQRFITGVISSFNEVALPTPVASSQLDKMEEHDNLTVVEDEKSKLGDEKSVVLPRRLFQSRKQPCLDTEDDSWDTSPIAKRATVKYSTRPNPTGGVAAADPQNSSGTHANPEIGKGDASLTLGLSDEDRLRTVVISSSEDESDHLERVAQAFSAQLSSPTATTPPHSRPMSSRLARRRRVISSPTSDTDSDSYVSCRQIKTPTKTGRSRKQLTPGQCLATSDIKRSEQPTNKRSVRSSTMSQRQKKVSGDSGKALESSESSSDGIRSTVRRKVPIAVSRLSDSDDSDPIAHIGYGARSHKCLGKPAPALVSNDGHSSSEEIITPSRKRRLAGAGAAPDSPNVRLVAASDQIVDDLHEDVEDLKETELRNHRTRATNRTPKKTKAQQQLELLKRRRAGRNVVDVSSGSEDNAVKSPRRRLIFNEETDSRDDETGVESEQLGDNDPPLTLEDEDLDQYDEDFVVEDEDEPLGAPHSLSEIPLEFTRHAHKKPIEHFKDAVEWMVHNLLNPAFPRDDPIYQVAVQKLDDEVRGLAGSKFMSAAWNTDFLSTLKAKPDIAYLDAHGLFEQHCEACNRSNHPAKFQLIFSGKPYNRQSLEEISDDEDEEDATKSQDGRFGGDEKSFYVGRTCCANAETSHALHHWRYALNQWVLEWLTRRGHTSADKIVERERWSTKKRTQYANDVVDGMEANGEVRVLYKEFKENLQAARDARPDTYTYGRKR